MLILDISNQGDGRYCSTEKQNRNILRQKIKPGYDGKKKIKPGYEGKKKNLDVKASKKSKLDI